jgi:hypothetical protein
MSNADNAESFVSSETFVELRYPNGRVFETVADREIRVGQEFEMYGRTWRAIQTKQNRRHEQVKPFRTVCVPAG